MYVLVFLIICMTRFFALLNGEKVDHRNGPRQWHDFENFVYQKFEDMERLLAIKDERIDQLQSIVTNQNYEITQLKQGMTSLKQEILHKNGIVDKLVNRIRQLERNVKPDTNPQESEQHPGSSTPLLNKCLDKLRSLFGETTSLRQDIRSLPAVNEKRESALRQQLKSYSESKDDTHADSLPVIEKTEAVEVSSDKLSSPQQKRVALRQTIAFHVALSSDKNYHPGNTIIYDKEKLDHGDGYIPGDGIYTVPESGTYIFTWTSICNDHEFYQTVIAVNGAYMGSSWTNAQDQSSTVVVLTLTQGDHVFIRMGSQFGQGTLLSRNTLGESTFSGWKLD